MRKKREAFSKETGEVLCPEGESSQGGLNLRESALEELRKGQASLLVRDLAARGAGLHRGHLSNGLWSESQPGCSWPGMGVPRPHGCDRGCWKEAEVMARAS